MDEVGGPALAEVLDVEAAARRQELHPAAQLARAVAGVGAAPVGVVLLRRGQARAAFRAQRRVDELALGAVAHLGDRAENLGDDVAGLADGHPVADEHALARDLRRVVQRGHFHRRAGDGDRAHHGVRRRPAGAADGHADVEQLRGDLLRRVLVRDRPPRRPRRRAEGPLLPQVIDLDHQAVHLVFRIVAVLAPVQHLLDDVVGRFHAPGVRRDVEAPRRQRQVGVVLAGRAPALDVPDAVADHGQRALGGLGGVLLPQRPGGRVAGVGEDALPGGGALGVEVPELLDGDVDLAADLQDLRHRVVIRCGELVRDVGDGAGVGGDVLPHPAVAAGRRADEAAVFVDQVDGQAVDLQLGQVGARRGARQPVAQFRFVEDVVQAVQALQVLHRFEGDAVGRRVDAGADLLRRAVRHGELRVRRLQVLEAAEQLVVLRVRDDGLAGVVLRRMVPDLVGQFLPLPAHVRGGGGGVGGGAAGRGVGDAVGGVCGVVGHADESRRRQFNPAGP